jgi:hypothetical protein
MALSPGVSVHLLVHLFAPVSSIPFLRAIVGLPSSRPAEGLLANRTIDTSMTAWISSQERVVPTALEAGIEGFAPDA